MNRFRALKENLISSKRDSQKLQDKLIQDWLNKSLDYYGIDQNNYKISRNMQLHHLENKQQKQKQRILQHNQDQTKYIFTKKMKPFYELAQIIGQSNDHQSSSQANTKKYSKQIKEVSEQDTHLKSMKPQVFDEGKNQKQCPHKIYKQQKQIQKNNQNQNQTSIFVTASNKEILSNFSNINIQQKQPHVPQQKQYCGQTSQFLDYYSLIMQLTNELQYCRMNNEKKNQKSILKQLKNLIQFIQTQVKTPHSSISQLLSLSGSAVAHNKNQDRNNNDSDDANDMQDLLLKQKQVQRQIKYRLIKKQNKNTANQTHSQSQNHNKSQVQSQAHNKSQPFRSYNKHNSSIASSHETHSIDTFQQDQNNKTFASQEIQQSAKKRSIIELVDAQDMQQLQQFYSGIKINQRIFSQSNSIAEDSPLSRITEHQSQYKSSMNPTPSSSPPKLNRNKTDNLKCLLDQWLKQDERQEIQFTKIKNRTGKTQKYDKYDKTNETNLFQQSLQYKKIQYMLDSEDNSVKKSQSENRSSRFNSSQGSYEFQRNQNQYEQRGKLLIKKKNPLKICLNQTLKRQTQTKNKQNSKHTNQQSNENQYILSIFKDNQSLQKDANVKYDQYNQEKQGAFQNQSKFMKSSQESQKQYSHARSKTSNGLLSKTINCKQPYTISLQQLKKQIINNSQSVSVSVPSQNQNSYKKVNQAINSNKSKHKNYLSKGSSSSSKGKNTSSLCSSNSPNENYSSTSVNQWQNGLQKSKCSRKSSKSIKYKVYTTAFQNQNKQPPVHSHTHNTQVQKSKIIQKNSIIGQKQDKKKVLKDIVNILNTKYNKNISLNSKQR